MQINVHKTKLMVFAKEQQQVSLEINGVKIKQDNWF